ncbi:NPXTG-anchored protein [Ruminococcus sp.]|uniref:NPXTG-anchored protein n=1 Tax=Ruminococcus sp. TaxID=41978 RepID=UPI0025CB7C5C|nr:NPXTG-anchored protein [Ruminococcus sp.]
MRISKIIAGMSALAIAASMAVVANAQTVSVATPSDKEWDGFAKYTNADGAEDNDFIWGGTLTKGSDLTVTLNFEWTEKGSDAKFCAVKPAYANGWDPVFADEAPEGWVENSQDTDDDGNRLDADGNPCDFAWQNDGFLQAYTTDVTSFTFTIPASVVDTMYDNANAEEGFDGLLFQVGNNGMKITSIDFSQDVQWYSEHLAEPADESSSVAENESSSTAESSSESSKADESSKAESSKAESSKASSTASTATKTNNATTTATSSAAASDATASDNTNQATGATAGLALAGLALAGAVAVVSKRK